MLNTLNTLKEAATNNNYELSHDSNGNKIALINGESIQLPMLNVLHCNELSLFKINKAINSEESKLLIEETINNDIKLYIDIDDTKHADTIKKALNIIKLYNEDDFNILEQLAYDCKITIADSSTLHVNGNTTSTSDRFGEFKHIITISESAPFKLHTIIHELRHVLQINKDASKVEQFKKMDTHWKNCKLEIDAETYTVKALSLANISSKNKSNSSKLYF